MPAQKPGKSRQDYGTPADLIAAVIARFGPLHFDLAASRHNAQALTFYSETDDSLRQPWAELHCGKTLWLNPPFFDIEAWASKCASEAARMAGGKILFLTPASVGSDWYRTYVHPAAVVLPLSPRLIFAGETEPYPKDCMLSVFGLGVRGFEPWRWK